MHKYKLLIYAGSAHLANIMIGVVFSFLCTRLMSSGTFGNLRYVMTWLPILMVISLPGYDMVILREINRGRHVSMWRVLAIRFSGGVIGSIILTAVVMVFFPNVPSALKFFFLWVALALPFFETATGYRNYLIATRLKRHGLRLATRNRFLSSLILIVSGGVIYVAKLDPKWLLPMYLVSLIVPTLTTYLSIAKRQYRRIMPLNYKGLHLHTAIFTSLAGLFNTVAFSLDKLMLHYYLGATTLAFYSILVMFPAEIARMIDSVYPIYYRQLFLRKRRIGWSLVGIMIGLGALGIAVYAAVFVVLSPLVFGAFYQYDFLLVLLAALLMLSGAFEYYVLQRIFASYGGKLFLIYSGISILISYVLYSLVLPGGGINTNKYDASIKPIRYKASKKTNHKTGNITPPPRGTGYKCDER